MVYAYVRVSTDKQTVKNQRYEISRFCRENELIVDKWVEESISGTTSVQDRGLGKTLKKMKGGDILICSELSRLGRNLLMIMGVLNECMMRDIRVWTIKDGYRLGNDICCKVLAFAFGLSAEIERDLISQRTKEALARKRDEGAVLGRPKGTKSGFKKLTGKEAEMKVLLDQNVPKSAIARALGVNRATILRFAKETK